MGKKIYILTPCFNDFESLYDLLLNIDCELDNNSDVKAGIVVVNDGSTDPEESALPYREHAYNNITEIKQLNLCKNVGHQRAICIGLAYINSLTDDFDGVVVMDSDGEDDYRDVFRLTDEMHHGKIVFAKRRKRSESPVFRVFYAICKFIFYFLTGQFLHGGNFSVIPKELLSRVVNLNEIWNHYYAGIKKSKISTMYIDCDRAKRYKGKSKMNFYSLVIHGLSSISVFNDVVFARLFCFSAFISIFGFVMFICGILLINVFHIALNTMVIPVIGTATLLCILLLILFLCFELHILGNRDLHKSISPDEIIEKYVVDAENISLK